MPGVLYALAGYLLLALVVTFPLVLSFGRSLSDPVDPLLNAWILAWEHQALLHFPNEFLDANIFYPHKGTLLYSETLLVPSLLLFPVMLVTANAIACHNLLVLFGFAFTGTSGYLLGRWLFRNAWSAWALGGVLAFNTYTLSNIGQAQLLHLEWLPLALLYLGRLLRQPTLRDALLMAIFLAAQFYTAVYYGIYSFVIVGAVGGIAWLLTSYPGMKARMSALMLLAGGIVFAILLCWPMASRYYRLSQVYGYARTIEDAWPFSASLEMWTTALPNNLIYGRFLGAELPKLGYYPVDSLFPGFVLLLAASLGLFLWLARSVINYPGPSRAVGSRFVPFLLLASIVALFVLSLGPYPQWVTLQPNFEIRLPYIWLHEWVPGFQALRAPGRFAYPFWFGLAIAVAYLVHQLKGQTARVVLLALLGVETLAISPWTLSTPELTEDQRAAYQWLGEQPRSAYVEYPIYVFGEEEAALRWLESQFNSLYHWHSSPVGYSGFFPPRHLELQRFLAGLPNAEVLHFLQAAGVQWLVLHRNRIDDEKWFEIESVLDSAGWQRTQWGDVWVVKLPWVESSEPSVQYMIPETAQRAKTVQVGAIFASVEATPLLPSSPSTYLRYEWWQGERRVEAGEKVYQPPFYVERVAVANAVIPTPHRAGDYMLRLIEGTTGQEIVSGSVHVINDVAPPERQLLPWRATQAEIHCVEGEEQLVVTMQTIGWYDSPLTLSARFVNATGIEIGRSAADVEFAADVARQALLSEHVYALPLDEVPATDALMVNLIAYHWQQEAERIVTRHFVTDDGSVVETLQLPVQRIMLCN